MFVRYYEVLIWRAPLEPFPFRLAAGQVGPLTGRAVRNRNRCGLPPRMTFSGRGDIATTNDLLNSLIGGSTMNQVICHKSTGAHLLLAFVFAFAVGSSQVFAAEEITGDWEITMNFDGRESFATLSISRKADGSLAGKWGSGELNDLKFEDGKLTFVRILTFGDREFIMEYSGTLRDGKLTGTLSSDRGDTPANGARKKPKCPALGQWDMKFNVGDREIIGRLIISEKPDSTLAGKWDADYGEHTISNVKFEDGKLTFTRNSKMNDFEIETNFEGTIKGHKLTGVFKSQRGELPATGKRVGADLVGKWELTRTSERGTRTSMLTIYGDMTGRYESFGGEIPIKDLKLEGNQVTFYIEMGFGDQTFKMDFKGKLDGKSLNGELTTSRGTSEFTGKKVEVASPLVGTWEITRKSSRGTRTNTLKIKADMTGTYTSRDNEIEITDLKVDGDQVSFKVIMRYGERDVPMEFKGRLDGKTLNGERTTSRGTSKFTGKKVD